MFIAGSVALLPSQSWPAIHAAAEALDLADRIGEIDRFLETQLGDAGVPGGAW
jgi:hypothetical protein